MKHIQPPVATPYSQERQRYLPVSTSYPKQLSSARRPEVHYIPRHIRHKEPDGREALLGCGMLLLMGILGLTLLYYLSIAR